MSAVQKWYENRTIFITGATGFMGKVLLEKMLRSLPDIKEIILLVRPKRGLEPSKRLENIKNLIIFDNLKRTNPKVFSKIKFIEGDLTKENLGLQDNAKHQLANVSVVFHMAASLRLEAGVKDAVIANTLSTKLILDLCQSMEKLECFLHLSTAFCYGDKEILDEYVHPAHCDPYETIKYILNESEDVLIRKEAEILSYHPNSYTFSKRLAECVVYDYRKKLPVVIARPSIVIPAVREPVPGWVDSLNGPIGIVCAAGKGVLRSMLCVEHYSGQVVPVDLAINSLIVIPTKKYMTKQEVPVYNLNIPNNYVDMKWGELIWIGRTIVKKYPFSWTLWYPDGAIRTNVFTHWLVLILFQWIPAIFLDGIFFLIGRERFMIRVQKKIMVGLDVLQYFTMRQWHFVAENYRAISETLSGLDDEIFYCMNCTYNVEEYFTNALLIIKRQFFHENPKYQPYTRFYFNFLYILHVTAKYYVWYLAMSILLKILGFGYLLTIKYWFDFL